MLNKSSKQLSSKLPLLLLLLLFNFIVTTSPGTITIYFYSKWDHTNIHYNADNKGWTPVPGVAMEPSQNKSFPYPPWMQYQLKATTMQFVFNDGKGNWQNGNSLIFSNSEKKDQMGEIFKCSYLEFMLLLEKN